jgi:DNA-binding MarR family transcriptional regulator
MATRIDETHLAAWRAFLNAHAAVIDRIEHEMASARQLPLTSYDVLVALSEAPDHRLRPHELADHMVLRRSTLTRLLDRLEEEGLVVRERCGTDRRGAYVVLTEDGARTLRQAWPVYARGIAAHFTSLISDDEARLLTATLERISEAARRDQPTQ